MTGETPERPAGRIRAVLRAADGSDRTLALIKRVRAMLPGDHDYGDPLSLAGTETPHLLGQRLTAITAERPSALREAGLTALQVWQALSESQGRGRGDADVAILFTDVVGFSEWALEAGDDDALELLRCLGKAVEPPISAHGGRVVKRLGDGLMAVFDDAGAAVDAALDAVDAAARVEVSGHHPELRAGVHIGRPRRLGGDYFGVDVNVAARVAAAAGSGEVLVSDVVAARVGGDGVDLKPKRRFRAKGAPKELSVFEASRA